MCPGEGQADRFGGLEVGGAGWEPGRRFCGFQGTAGVTPGQVASWVGRPGGAGMGTPAAVPHAAGPSAGAWMVSSRASLGLPASLPPSPLLCVYTWSYMRGLWDHVALPFVITLHTWLKLIELISDKAVCSLPAGWISFLSARSVCPAWELGAGLLAFGVTAGRGSLGRAGHRRLSALHSRGCLVPGGVSRVADAEHAQEGRNQGRS